MMNAVIKANTKRNASIQGHRKAVARARARAEQENMEWDQNDGDYDSDDESPRDRLRYLENDFSDLNSRWDRLETKLNRRLIIVLLGCGIVAASAVIFAVAKC